jgi:hypothetical protein|nr:MAG TPA: hypothetical protein [Caudoviricetes sp.]
MYKLPDKLIDILISNDIKISEDDKSAYVELSFFSHLKDRSVVYQSRKEITLNVSVIMFMIITIILMCLMKHIFG